MKDQRKKDWKKRGLLRNKKNQHKEKFKKL